MAPPTPPIVVSSDNFKPLALSRSDTVATFEDDVREVSHEVRMRLAPDDETGSHDPDFRRSKVDDLNACVDEYDRKKLAEYLPEKISFEARNRCNDALRHGLDDESKEALEDGLKLLNNKLGDGFESWILNRVDILLELGRTEEARALLGGIKIPKEGSIDMYEMEIDQPVEKVKKRAVRGSQRPQFTQTPSTRRRSTIHTDVEYTDVEYEKMLRLDLCRKKLDLALRAEEWDQVKATQKDLHGLDPSYFDIQKPLERFAKIRQLLNIGQLHERDAEEATNDPVQKRKSLDAALRTYNHGCYATELFHQDTIMITSIARTSSSRLREYFLEQGRSRALLDSIIRGDEFVPPLQKTLIDNAIDSVVYAAQASIRIKKRDSMLPDSNPPSPPSQAVSPTEAPPDAFRIPPNASPIFMQVVNKAKRRNTSDGAGESSTPLDSEPSSPVFTPLTPRSPRGSFSEEQMRRLRVQMRWRRAKLYAFSEINPTFKAALAALPNSSSSIKSFREMSQSIPPNTLIIEYGLPSSSPSGLVTLLISSEGVEVAAWREAEAKEIISLIRTLRKKMSDENASVRREAPSPVSPKSIRSLPDFDDNTIQELRESLYRHLISPIELVLRTKQPDRIIIVPSGELAHVPWGMLLDVPFSIVPSLSIWHRLHEQSMEIVRTKPTVSVFSSKPKDEEGISRDIPYARVEALYLSWLHDHAQRPELADDHDRKSFEKFSRTMEVLHLCAHSNFDDLDPAKSSVQLFKEPWFVGQWGELAIKAHLVVFSSCLSAVSKAYDSGSTFGFAHTLLATGTRAFIGSLWPVEDEPTLLLMMLFYEELRRPRPPVEALYIAQCRLRDLTEQQFWELVELLRKMFKAIGPDDSRKYVNSPRTWLRFLERYDVSHLKEPRNWAAFVLTGYGFQTIYPEPEHGIQA